jgi:hypothetical protein
MKPIVTMECEDCGKYVIANPADISCFKLDDEITSISRCPYCDRVMMQETSEDILPAMNNAGINIFDWRTGEKVVFNRTK